MTYFLLTGATGLLGRYLLRDLTLAEVPLAVVVRPSKFESAAGRIETAMARWEQELGRLLVRPVVLEGDISEPALGLSDRDVGWLRERCGSMIHSAASLTFHADEKTGEPERSNLHGTRNVLDLCERADIRQLHHVSTAYVCGLRRGRILETELDVGQQTGNDYERTKLAAEKEARACAALQRVTVYRPSIIVGDSRTGFTTSYHGFYTPLRIVYSLLQSIPWDTILRGDFLGRLQLEGHERKNLVSVEWVSAAMTRLITDPARHGNVYHLTNPAPATALEMQEAFIQAIGEVVMTRQTLRTTTTQREDFVASFREQMGIYQAYWSDDPAFDSTHTETALADLPCPRIDREVMHRLIRFAIGANFGWPRESAIVAPFDLGKQLAGRIAADEATPAAPREREVGLHVSGPGGGQWHVRLDRRRLKGIGPGLPATDATTCYLSTETFVALARGRATVEDAINAGRLVVTGDAVPPSELSGLWRALASSDNDSVFQHAFR